MGGALYPSVQHVKHMYKCYQKVQLLHNQFLKLVKGLQPHLLSISQAHGEGCLEANQTFLVHKIYQSFRGHETSSSVICD